MTHINLLWFYEVKSNSGLLPKEEEYEYIFDELENLLLYSINNNICINFDLPPKVLEYFRNIGLVGNYVNKNDASCFAENGSNVYMNVRGEIYPCHPFYEKFEFGYNLQNGNYDEYSSAIKKILGRNFKKDDMCQECVFAENCLRCPIENKNIALCRYVEQRCYKIYSKLACDNCNYHISGNYRLVFKNRIIDLSNNRVFLVSDEALSIIEGKSLKKEITKLVSMELYGLIKNGVLIYQ